MTNPKETESVSRDLKIKTSSLKQKRSRTEAPSVAKNNEESHSKPRKSVVLKANPLSEVGINNKLSR